MSLINIEILVKIAEVISTLGFLTATVIFARVIKKYPKSTAGSIFFYITLGTSIYIFISLFLNLGHEYFNISDNSFETMWHLMFYASFAMYYVSLRSMVGMTMIGINQDKPLSLVGGQKFGVSAFVLIAVMFFAPHLIETMLAGYTSSILFSFGLHHFIAFGIAGLVAYYVLQAKKRFGSFALSIATPFIITVSALSLQHLWELLSESWNVILVTSEIGEGVEKLFLVIAAGSLVWGALRLKKFSEK